MKKQMHRGPSMGEIDVLYLGVQRVPVWASSQGSLKNSNYFLKITYNLSLKSTNWCLKKESQCGGRILENQIWVMWMCVLDKLIETFIKDINYEQEKIPSWGRISMAFTKETSASQPFGVLSRVLTIMWRKVRVVDLKRPLRVLHQRFLSKLNCHGIKRRGLLWVLVAG